MRLFDVADGEEDESPADGVERAAHYATADVTGGAGWVGVDRRGEVTEISLDDRVVRSMRPAHLGSYLVAAVHEAETRARTTRVAAYRKGES